ncbi:MAG: strictosidine synthase family protein [Oceanicaulis sp.]
MRLAALPSPVLRFSAKREGFIRIILLVLAVLVVLAGARLAYVVVPASGLLTDPEPTDTASCQAVEIAPGTEDVVHDAATGLVFISAMNRRSKSMDPRNGIYAFGLDDPQGTLRLVSTDTPADFRPHGIGLYRDGETARLFVISHPASGSQILLFDIGEDGMLAHVRTVTDPAVFSPNDVTPAGPDSFYATNDSRFGPNMPGYLEGFFGLPLASIAFFDGQEGRIAANGLTYANGVQLSRDGERLYAANFIGRKVFVYDRDPENGALTRTATHRVPLGLDNIELGPEGDLWIGGNRNVFAFLAHQSDPAARAPSQAVRVDPETGAWETVFYDDGSAIDSISVATPVPGAMIYGAVFDDHVLICPRET